MLTIETRSVQLTAEYGLRRPGVALSPGPFSVLTFTDTGHGMDRETLQHLFEPFFTTKGLGKGSGLGLAMVYGIVKQSGGYIWPYSEPALGTTFKIYLPSVTDTLPVPADPVVEQPVTSKGATVLLVEDDPLVRTIAKRSLMGAGFEVLDAADGHMALKTLAQHHQIDLVITDLAMPELGGRELAQRLSRSRPDLPIIFMSGYTDDDLARRDLLEAGVRYLEKPFSPQALVRIVQDVLDSTQAARPSLSS